MDNPQVYPGPRKEIVDQALSSPTNAVMKTVSTPGIDLLSHYAGMAMQGFMSDKILQYLAEETRGDAEKSYKVMATDSFDLAEAMLKEREKRLNA